MFSIVRMIRIFNEYKIIIYADGKKYEVLDYIRFMAAVTAIWKTSLVTPDEEQEKSSLLP